MKICAILLFMLIIASCTSGKEATFIASTPADAAIRPFLGISLTDSIDFIRWHLTLRDNQYTLSCNYGIGKPNTNGFINGGKKIELNGAFKKEKNFYILQNGNSILKIAELNSDLLHLLNADNSLLVGNGGWSYTLNNVIPAATDQVNINAQQAVIKDSMVFVGRTPCKVPGIIPKGMQCYKLKWHIVLYANTQKNEPTTYKVYGTPYRKQGGKTGNWKIITGKKGRIIYQLNDDDGNGFLYLLKLDDHILIFTDAEGKLLVGDEDFSYTMNGNTDR